MLGCVITTLPQQPAVSRCEGGMVCRSEKVDEPVTNSVLSRERKRRRISCNMRSFVFDQDDKLSDFGFLRGHGE